MAKAKADQPVKSRVLTPEEIKNYIPRLKKRIEEFEGIDTSSITDSGDESVAAVHARTNNLIIEIYGENTEGAKRHTIHWYYLAGWSHSALREPTTGEIQAGYAKGIRTAVTSLRAIVENWEESLEFALPPSTSDDVKSDSTNESREVFIVHGHSNAIKSEVARFVEKLGFDPIILHEKANKGRTIIEKFEAHSGVGFAIVLFTGDDVGGVTEEKLKPRARQNVMLELGFFMGKLGREKVLTLYEEGVELPSDVDGIIYEPLGNNDHWQNRVVKEMKAAGLVVNGDLLFQ